MIELHTWGTPNGRKISIMLEECGLPYSVHKIDISKGEQFKPEFLRISPNNRIPAIVDHDGPDGEPISIMESGAILIYLADKTGKFMPQDSAQKYKTLEWLMWQMGGVGPMFGQAHHFLRAAPTKIEYGIKRYVDEAKRLYGVLDKQLAGNAFSAGADYSIADMAIFPWYGGLAESAIYGDAGTFLDVQSYKNLQRWTRTIAARPAVKRGRMVNRTSGDPAGQLRERHDASDFDTKTQDKLEAKS
jgi:GST-like protein